MRCAPLVVSLLLVACSCEDKKTTGAASDGAIPRVQFSAQPPASESPQPPDRMRATEAGYDLHESASTGCTDQKCVGGNCSKLCAQWMGDTSKEFSSAAKKNDMYFNCLGACLAGRHDK